RRRDAEIRVAPPGGPRSPTRPPGERMARPTRDERGGLVVIGIGNHARHSRLRTTLVVPLALAGWLALGSTSAMAAQAKPATTGSSSHADHSKGNAGTSGVSSEHQPLSKADGNNGGANGKCPGATYCSTRDGSPSGNGNGKGKATGKPCAGCVGKADNKNPPGQEKADPAGTFPNNGYECDRNHGIGRTNPAHTGCANGKCPGATYCSTRDGSPSGNGNGKGKATGKPCAGCVGKADNKNPPGQEKADPAGTFPNNGYECDRNHGIGRTNPAHTGCA